MDSKSFAKNIESMLQENRKFEPSDAFRSKAHFRSLEEYEREYRRSIEEPELFWAEKARQELVWAKPWDAVEEYDFTTIGGREAPFLRYFRGGELNVSYNCLDRHVEAGRGSKTAIIWHPEGVGGTHGERREVTYAELTVQVKRFANVLRRYGVTKGTTVTLYMPMVPELPVAMLACARLGAIHSVVFSAFSPEALRSRINDCQSSVVVTADAGYHNGKLIQLKSNVDQALLECPSVKNVIVFDRAETDPSMQSGRDVWWHDVMKEASTDCPAVPFESETPLYILYTSGSTGKPKGVVHTSAGYLLFTHLSFKTVFDIREDDIFWCTADIGWVTGHSYVVYGPLSNGSTVLIYEGVPTYPTPDRFWELIAKERVSVFYTAPTAIRALMRLGEKWPAKHDLSSLRLLGSVGEPINPEAWVWYHQVIGKGSCPIVDTWWQTETGGIMISTLPGAMSMKPGSAGKPLFGVCPKIVRSDGEFVQKNEGGSLLLTRPWPGMLRGVYGDTKNELIKNVYFSQFEGKYFSGDGCRVDEDGYYWLLGRIDDVINVSAHRFATAEIESALVSHPAVAEAAVVGFPHETKGQGIYCFVTLKQSHEPSESIRSELVSHVRKEISPIATPDRIHFTPGLPKTRSGKIMRRILRKVAEGKPDEVGDTSTLADPGVVSALLNGMNG